MVKPNAKKIRKNGPSGSHQVNWLWGQQLVADTIEANRWQVYELFITAEVSHRYRPLLKSKNTERIEIEIVSESRLEELSKTAEHGGIVARVSKYPYESLENLRQLLQPVRVSLESDPTTSTPNDISVDATRLHPKDLKMPADRAINPSLLLRQPLIVLVDRIQDTFVFASILRCCENAAVTGVIVGEFCQAQVTTQVARATEGAVNHFPIFRTESLVDAANSMKEVGFKLIAVDVLATQSLCETPLTSATAIFVGSEPVGIDPDLKSMCDHVVKIPSFGRSTSLPASVTAGILLYEIRRQQRSKS